MKKRKSKRLKAGYVDWLKAKDKKTGSVKEYPGSPAYWLDPKDIETYANALTPEELWMNPNTLPLPHYYPTTAANIRQPPEMDQSKNVTAMFAAKADPSRDFTTSWKTKRNSAQGVYEHEVAHERDPRRNPYKMWSFPNHGFTTYNGLSGGLLQREFPAMIAERDWRREQNGT